MLDPAQRDNIVDYGRSKAWLSGGDPNIVRPNVIEYAQDFGATLDEIAEILDELGLSFEPA